MRLFAEVLRDWQAFDVTFVTALAATVSLMFAVVSLNRNDPNRKDGGECMWVARQTFCQFLMLFLLAILLLAPHRSPTSVGLLLPGQVGALAWLAAVLVNLLLFTCRNAWFLLVHIHKWDAWRARESLPCQMGEKHEEPTGAA